MLFVSAKSKIETARGEEEEGDEENQRHQPERIAERRGKRLFLFLARREKLCSIYICSSRPTSVNDQGRNAFFSYLPSRITKEKDTLMFTALSPLLSAEWIKRETSLTQGFFTLIESNLFIHYLAPMASLRLLAEHDYLHFPPCSVEWNANAAFHCDSSKQRLNYYNFRTRRSFVLEKTIIVKQWVTMGTDLVSFH